MAKFRTEIKVTYTGQRAEDEPSEQVYPLEGDTQEEMYVNVSFKLWEILMAGPMNDFIIRGQVKLLESLKGMKVDIPGYTR